MTENPLSALRLGGSVSSAAMASSLDRRCSRLENVQEAVVGMAQRSPEMLEAVKAMRSTNLHPLVEMTYVMEAAKLRWDEPTQDHYNALNKVRRNADSDGNLWNVYNRVQETLIRGDRWSGVRRITSPAADVVVNQKLWDLTQHFVN
jgi:hypothetical protein